MENNAPVYTLYLSPEDGTFNHDNNSYTWNIQWRSVFPFEPRYENYLMTHSFHEAPYTMTSFPTDEALGGMVYSTGLPFVLNSNNLGASNILNVYEYKLIPSNETGVAFVGSRLCLPNSVVLGGIQSLTSSSVTLLFVSYDSVVPELTTNFVHKLQFTPVLNN